MATDTMQIKPNRLIPEMSLKSCNTQRCHPW
jgi:hypothetical protein